MLPLVITLLAVYFTVGISLAMRGRELYRSSQQSFERHDDDDLLLVTIGVILLWPFFLRGHRG